MEGGPTLEALCDAGEGSAEQQVEACERLLREELFSHRARGQEMRRAAFDGKLLLQRLQKAAEL
eukprot:scaffold3380_cov86-Pinguiococcus_pyrenoidosus.AAC.1